MDANPRDETDPLIQAAEEVFGGANEEEQAELKRRFFHEMHALGAVALNPTLVDMIATKVRMTRDLESAEDKIQQMETRYREQSAQSGFGSLLSGWDLGNTSGGAAGATSSVNPAAKLLAVSQSKKYCDYLKKLSLQQEKRAEFPFSLTSVTSRPYREAAAVFELPLISAALPPEAPPPQPAVPTAAKKGGPPSLGPPKKEHPPPSDHSVNLPLSQSSAGSCTSRRSRHSAGRAPQIRRRIPEADLAGELSTRHINTPPPPEAVIGTPPDPPIVKSPASPISAGVAIAPSHKRPKLTALPVAMEHPPPVTVSIATMTVPFTPPEFSDLPCFSPTRLQTKEGGGGDETPGPPPTPRSARGKQRGRSGRKDETPQPSPQEIADALSPSVSQGPPLPSAIPLVAMAGDTPTADVVPTVTTRSKRRHPFSSVASQAAASPIKPPNPPDSGATDCNVAQQPCTGQSQRLLKFEMLPPTPPTNLPPSPRAKRQRLPTAAAQAASAPKVKATSAPQSPGGRKRQDEGTDSIGILPADGQWDNLQTTAERRRRQPRRRSSVPGALQADGPDTPTGRQQTSDLNEAEEATSEELPLEREVEGRPRGQKKGAAIATGGSVHNTRSSTTKLRRSRRT